jgi:predicted RNA binding protein YcfA (HicA-like mRNA interferase family)
MSERLPSLKADEVISALRKAGFEVTRIKGSHHIMRHRNDASRGTVVPFHAGKDIKRGFVAQDHRRCRPDGRRVQGAAVT